MSLSPYQEDSPLPLESDIPDICPDYLYSPESGTEEEIHYSKVPEGFLPVVVQEFPGLGLRKVLFLESLSPGRSLDTLCDIRIDPETLRPLIEFPYHYQVGGDSESRKTGGEEAVLVLQDILPVEGVQYLSGLFNPEEILGKCPGVETPGGFLYILGGYKHTYNYPPV
ncbi:MAG: hypothetical protein BWY86_00044 [Candidatus Aminicenantes bacterium ADurb.Bin508]|nr:MAG: hypothetical protein BWY86_00044 [Candidatus Aminicenantes bacterium ADurb.Bin508]